MALMTLRVRHCGKAVTLEGVPEDCTVEGLRQLIAVETGVPSERQVLKVGTPPALIKEVAPDARIQEVGCCNRATLILEERGGGEPEPELPPKLPELPELGGSDEGNAAKRRRLEAQGEEEVLVDDDDDDDDGGGGGRNLGGGARSSSSAVVAESGRRAAEEDVRESGLLPAFDRAIRAAEQHARLLPEDKHQVWALKKGKAAVLESLKRGDDISLGALHTLPRVGHWVVQQVREQVQMAGSSGGAAAARPGPPRSSAVAPPTTLANFSWWYVNKKGKRVEYRNDAECKGPPGSEQYRVCILHSSGRMEKAYLPEHKAPPRVPAGSQGSQA
mmetsp:Transcript_34719/g.98560  ORF Transcript_34719/g.98560 Transcript_34719/m.98560 type:complete len:331 (+) Transcript_34719:70-1062(+)